MPTEPESMSNAPMSVGHAIAGAPLALDMERAGRHLITWPDVHEPPLGAVNFLAGTETMHIAAGERYAVSRGVAVVPVRGVLTPNFAVLEKWFGWATYQGLEETAAALAADQDVTAVVMEFDTPGGMVLQIDAAAEALAALTSQKPVHALVNPLAASAGYWLASQATTITMTPGSLVGSIGVVSQTAWPVAPGASGNQVFYTLSEHARAKWPDPTTEEGRAEIARDLATYERAFHAAVASGRKIDPAALAMKLSVTDDPRDGGAVFGPQDAVARDMADDVSTRAAFYSDVFGRYAPNKKPKRAALRNFAATARAAGAISDT